MSTTNCIYGTSYSLELHFLHLSDTYWWWEAGSAAARCKYEKLCPGTYRQEMDLCTFVYALQRERVYGVSWKVMMLTIDYHSLVLNKFIFSGWLLPGGVFTREEGGKNSFWNILDFLKSADAFCIFSARTYIKDFIEALLSRSKFSSNIVIWAIFFLINLYFYGNLKKK